VIIDNAASFGINAGHTTHTVSLIENLGTEWSWSDKIDLKDVASSGVVHCGTCQAGTDGMNHFCRHAYAFLQTRV
jgi:hypothetical protein